MRPILFTPQGVAFEIRCLLILDPGFLSSTRHRDRDLYRMAYESLQPSPEVLSVLKLTPAKGGYVWQPE